MRYLLTGATGFIGGRVARRLREAGHEVLALVRHPARAQSLDDLGVHLAVGELGDRASLRAAMRSVDGVFHIAGWYHVGARDKRSAQATNVLGTRRVLEAMQELGIRRGAYTSTLAVNSDTRGRLVDESYRYEGRHLSVYDRTKAEAHRLAEEFIARGLPLIVVLPGLVYGPGDSSIARGITGLRVAAGTTYFGDNSRARRELGLSGQPGQPGQQGPGG